MTWTIDNFDVMPRPLNYDDKVEFIINSTLLRYDVRDNFLQYEGDGNDIVFNLLGIGKYEFASIHYGYHSNNGGWPVAKMRDFKALTNLVCALFELIIEREGRRKLKTPKSPKKLNTGIKKHYNIIDDLSDLSSVGELNVDDIVNFRFDHNIFTYTVKSSYLFNKYVENSEVFISPQGMGLTFNEMVEFVSNSYGYLEDDPTDHSWPECRKGDFKALTNLVRDIYRSIPSYKVKSNKLNTNTKTEKHGKIIEVQRITPTVIKGERRRGSTISSGQCKITVGIGHLSNKKISRQ